MWLLLCTMLFVLVGARDVFAQGAGVNTLNPDPSAVFDITSTDKGLLIPRLTTGQRNAIVLPATGLLVFNSTLARFEYNAGTPAVPAWRGLIDDIALTSTAWSTTGNAGTNVASSFLGTTDAIGLSLRTNNTERIRITPTGSIGIAEAAPTGLFAVGNGSPFYVTSTGAVVALSVTAVNADFSGTLANNALNAGGVVVAQAGSGELQLGTAGTDYESPLLFQNGLSRSANSISLGGSLTTNTIVNLNSNTLRFDGGQIGLGTAPQQTLDIAGGLRIGTTNATAAGSLRWSGTDFEGHDGAQWVSLTAGGSSGTFWDVTGNTVVAGQFLGSSNNADVHLRANNTTTAVFAANGSIRRDDSGDARGANSLDWQSSRTASSQVASGFGSVVLGGADNTASADYALVGGYSNSASGAFSSVVGGRNLTLGAESFGFQSGAVATDWSASSSIAAFGNVDVLLFNNNNSASQLRLYEPGVSPTTDNYSAFVARNQSQNLIYELPAIAPTTTSQVLAVESIGGNIQLNWTSVAAASLGLSGNVGEIAFFGSSTSLTSSSEFYWNNASNRLGLGTLAPTNQLHLTAGMRLGNSTNAFSGAMRWTGTDFEGYDGSTWVSLTANGASGGTWNVTGNTITGSQYLGSSNAAALRIRTDNTERMVVATNGNIGIGTAAPTSSLDIHGDLKVGTTGTSIAKIVKASVAKNIGSVGSGIGLTTTFTVPGAETGSSVSISPDQSIGAGLIISWARVSSSDTVEIGLYNVSGSPIDPPNMDFHITVIK